MRIAITFFLPFLITFFFILSYCLLNRKVSEDGFDLGFQWPLLAAIPVAFITGQFSILGYFNPFSGQAIDLLPIMAIFLFLPSTLLRYSPLKRLIIEIIILSFVFILFGFLMSGQSLIKNINYYLVTFIAICFYAFLRLVHYILQARLNATLLLILYFCIVLAMATFYYYNNALKISFQYGIIACIVFAFAISKWFCKMQFPVNEINTFVAILSAALFALS